MQAGKVNVFNVFKMLINYMYAIMYVELCAYGGK